MKLRLPRKSYDLRRILKPEGEKKGFETVSEALKEDKFRIKALRRYRQSSQGNFRKQEGLSTRAAKRVESKIESKVATLASSRHIRSQRRSWVGAVLEFAANQSPDNLKVFTLVPNRGWCVQGDDLASVDPKRFLARFRQQLVRRGIGGSSGWCIIYLHGEYDPDADTYQLHVHALAAGDTIAVMGELKLLPMYRHALPDAQERVKRPSLEQRWKDPARQGSYLAQGFWPSKPSYLKKGRIYRKRKRQRIPDPRFAEYLLWLAQHSFKDFVLLVGCQITAGRLASTR